MLRQGFWTAPHLRIFAVNSSSGCATSWDLKRQLSITGEIRAPLNGLSLGKLLDDRVAEPGPPAIVTALRAMNLVSGFQRYETAIENKLYRAINQLARLQRRRHGEFVPAPETVDVSIQPAREREL
jgi:hypothetical protein